MGRADKRKIAKFRQRTAYKSKANGATGKHKTPLQKLASKKPLLTKQELAETPHEDLHAHPEEE